MKLLKLFTLPGNFVDWNNRTFFVKLCVWPSRVISVFLKRFVLSIKSNVFNNEFFWTDFILQFYSFCSFVVNVVGLSSFLKRRLVLDFHHFYRLLAYSQLQTWKLYYNKQPLKMNWRTYSVAKWALSVQFSNL